MTQQRPKWKNNYTLPAVVWFLLMMWILPGTVLFALLIAGLIGVPLLARAGKRDQLAAAQRARRIRK